MQNYVYDLSQQRFFSKNVSTLLLLKAIESVRLIFI